MNYKQTMRLKAGDLVRVNVLADYRNGGGCAFDAGFEIPGRAYAVVSVEPHDENIYPWATVTIEDENGIRAAFANKHIRESKPPVDASLSAKIIFTKDELKTLKAAPARVVKQIVYTAMREGRVFLNDVNIGDTSA